MNYPFGGIHGLMVLIHPKYKATLVKNVICDAVLWLNVNLDGWEVIIGSYYFPCKTSKYFNESIFDDLAIDLLNIQSKSDKPVYLLGDANAHSGKLADILKVDDAVARELGLDLLSTRQDDIAFGPVVVQERANCDKKVDCNGKHLASMCQASELLILNGRAGQDRGVGNFTCFKLEEDGTHSGISTIDYCLASKNALGRVYDFEVDIFDRMLSDRHSPICLTLQLDQQDPILCPNFTTQDPIPHPEPSSPTIKYVEWSPSIAEAFNNALSQLNYDHLNSMMSATPNQTNIDNVCDELKKITIDAAIGVKACKVEHAKDVFKPKKKSRTVDYKPWFDKTCHDEKKVYFKMKNHAKRQGKKVVANKLSRDFKKLLESRRKKHNSDLNKRIKNLRSTCPRDYWNIINGSVQGKKVESKISMEVFLEHFRDLSVTKPENDHDLPGDPIDPDPLLNNPINVEEVSQCAQSLKNGKASGPDGIRNEFLKNLPSDLISLLTDFFNKILDSGVIPKEWSLGMIMPLFKNKGSSTDPSNYRGITLLSCFGKLFTAILNKRIARFMKSKDLLGMEQAGFRASHSTMDHVFTLHHIIDYYRQKGKQIYCAFVDYTKAFDLVNRSALWCKLFDQGISGKILKIIQNMYTEAKSCVKVGGKLSDYFQCTAGVRQGENLSPILFAIYLNDFKDYLGERSNSLKDLEGSLEEMEIYVKLYVLLYADDTVILAESASDLQNSLDALCSYSKLWDLKVNLTKTQIVIFSKGRITSHPTFMYDGKEVDVVDDYTYLGVIFNYNGNFKKAILNQKTVATRALKSLLDKARTLDLDIDTQMELFQRCVMPILLYGCEVWGYEKNNIKSLDVFYKRFIKTILDIYSFTPTCMVFGEAGQPNLYDLIKQRLISFWGKLEFDEVPRLSKHILRIIKNLNDKAIPGKDDKFKFPWLELTKDSLDELGLNFHRNPPTAPLDPKYVSCKVKTACSHVKIQSWRAEINANPQCNIYKSLKTEWGMPKYVHTLIPHLRTAMCRFRTRCHKLPVTYDRFKPCDRSKMICPLCDKDEVGDEYHYIFHCEHFKPERKKFLPIKYLEIPQSMDSFKELFSEEDTEIVSNLAKLCKAIMKAFNTEKPLTPLKVRKTHVMRSGRVSKRPGHLDIYFV